MNTGTKGALWTVIGLYLLSGVLFLLYMAYLLRAQSVYEAGPKTGSFGPLWCGNTITDPLALILNWGTPAALLACVALCTGLSAGKRTRSRGLAIALFLLPTACLLGFALWVFHGPWMDGACRVADVVWWVFGI